jgi:hypothetical protein
MSNILLITAGSLGLLIALVHGYLGETKVVGPVQEIPASAKRILQAIMFLSAVYWFLGAALLVASPFLLTQEQQAIAAIAVGALFLSGAIGNFWATRGKHFGWMLLTLATVLAWASAWTAI